MKLFAVLFVFLLSACSVNYTTESFVYQDKLPEKQINIAKIQTEIEDVQLSGIVSAVSLTADDGTTLKGVKLLNKSALINIVFFSANGMKISTSSKILNQFSLLPANVIWFDYRGVGASNNMEKLSLNRLRTDALRVFYFSKDELPSNLPMTIHGLSMGSLLAAYVAESKEIDALILDGAIYNVPELVDNLVPIWSKPFYSINLSPELVEINNVDSIRKYNKPLLLLIGEDDSTTPVENSQALYNVSESSLKELAIIPNTEHGETMKKDKALKAYQAFINQLICCEKG